MTCYAFEGRLRDNINRGGEKIGCEEVEEYVSTHPAVADAKLVAMPDPFYGEKGCVYLILRPGQAAPGCQGARRVPERTGARQIQVPGAVIVVDGFPLTRVGKVDKVEMRRMAAELVKGTAAPAPIVEGAPA